MVRSEEEIMAHLAREWGEDYEDALKWVLNDSNPKPIKKLKWQHIAGMSESGLRETYFRIINEMIDRFNLMING